MTAVRQQLAFASAPRTAPLHHAYLRRKCACGGHLSESEQCDACKAGQPALRRRVGGPSTGGLPPTVDNPAVQAVIGTSGQALDSAARGVMEARFGHDFSAVRVHADAAAARSAEAVDALAYTVGPHVVFGAGRYAPHSPQGRRLLAHELTHVVQQSAAGAEGGSLARDEAEADRVAAAFSTGASLPPISGSARGLRRQEATGATKTDGDVARAEAACDLRTLCRLHLADPRHVDVARVTAAYKRCAPGSLSMVTPGFDPCLSVAALAPPPTGLAPLSQPGPGAVAPTQQASGGGSGLHLPSTKLQFRFGALKADFDLPSSLSLSLPLKYHGVKVVGFELDANTPGKFALKISTDAVPLVRVSLSAGVSAGDKAQASAGLVIESKATTCHAQDPLTARAKLEGAGKKLRGAVEAARKASPDERNAKLADVVSAVVAVNGAIDAAKAKCKQVPRARLEFGAHMPLGEFQPQVPPSDSDRAMAPYVGATLTVPLPW
jgi:hypothetical protein